MERAAVRPTSKGVSDLRCRAWLIPIALRPEPRTAQEPAFLGLSSEPQGVAEDFTWRRQVRVVKRPSVWSLRHRGSSQAILLVVSCLVSSPAVAACSDGDGTVARMREALGITRP